LSRGLATIRALVGYRIHCCHISGRLAAYAVSIATFDLHAATTFQRTEVCILLRPRRESPQVGDLDQFVEVMIMASSTIAMFELDRFVFPR